MEQRPIKRKAILVVALPVKFAHELAYELSLWCKEQGYQEVEILDLSSSYFSLKSCFPSEAIPTSLLTWRLRQVRLLMRYRRFNRNFGLPVRVNVEGLVDTTNALPLSWKRFCSKIVESNSQDSTVGPTTTESVALFESSLTDLCRYFFAELLSETSVLRKDDPDWFVFNGRFPIEATFAFALRQLSLSPIFFEVGPRSRTFQIYSASPFSHDERSQIMRVCWDSAPEWNRNYDAYQFLLKRLTGADDATLFWSQGLDERPELERLAKGKRIVSFYCSTQGELASYDFGEKNPMFRNQDDALQWVLNHIDPRTTMLVIRNHPKTFSRGGDNLLAKVKIPRSLTFQYYDGKSRVDSLFLIRSSHLNIVYDSTIAADSILRRKPTLILGRPIFAVNFQKELSFQMAQDILELGDSQQYEIADLLPWAFYSARGGYSFMNSA